MCEAEPARAAVVVTGAMVESLCASECTNVYGGFVCVTEEELRRVVC